MAELKAFVFGMSLALTIGPIAVLIITVATRDGLSAGLWSALGAGSADFTLALAAFFAGAESARLTESLRRQIGVATSVILIAVGLRLLLKSLRSIDNLEMQGVPTLKTPFTQTYALTVVNPLGVIAFAAFGAQLPVAGSMSRAVWYAGYLFAGSLAVQFLLAMSGSVLGSVFTSSRKRAALGLTSGFAIACYGIVALVRDVSGWH